jgi:hypothetical protein
VNLPGNTIYEGLKDENDELTSDIVGFNTEIE